MRNRAGLSRVFNVLGAGVLAVNMVSAQAQEAKTGQYFYYEYPSIMTAVGGKGSVNFACDRFGRDPSRPRDLFYTCAAAEAADTNNQEFCDVTIPPLSAGSQVRMKAFAEVMAKTMAHFADQHKVCKARYAMLSWQNSARRKIGEYIEQNPEVTNAQVKVLFYERLQISRDDFDIPVNPKNINDMDYHKNPANWLSGWTTCPVDVIADGCKKAMGLN